MPFTPSHAAAALLFTRTPLVPAAIVAGSVAPDLPYYVPLPVNRELTHQPLGIVTIDLAIALVAFLAWQLLLRAPVIDLSPLWLRSRMPQRPAGRWWAPGARAVPVVLVLGVSLVVGSITHLAWDEFTHPGWLVDHVPLLRVQAGPLLVHKWLQHASSIVGLVAIALYAVRWVRRTPGVQDAAVVSDRARRAVWFTVGSVFVLSALIGWAVALLGREAQGLPFALLDPGVVFLTARICVASALATTVLVCAAWYPLRARSTRNPAVPA